MTGWFAVTPGPCFDGWHGLGIWAIVNPSTPMPLRILLALGTVTLVSVLAVSLILGRRDVAKFVRSVENRGVLALLVTAAMLIALRFMVFLDVEPAGYWPRWAFVWGLLAFGFALVKLSPPAVPGRKRWAIRLGAVVALYGLIVGGIAVAWFHRPLERLHAVVPGKIYISAMPTPRGLEIEQSRLHFKTIINLFPEETYQRSPYFEKEMEFVRRNGIRFVRSPGTAIDSDEFLDETLRLAQDPSAWPILVHCHGCMDRSPAWMGIYRFVVQGVPLAEVMKEIEDHRGCRPKASVTLLYNRVLGPRSPERYSRDPAAQLLLECARGTPNPYDLLARKRLAHPNPVASPGVSRR